MPKIALIGVGKTGRWVAELLSPDQLVGPFDSKRTPTREALEAADGVILFVEGSVMTSLIPLLLDVGKPVVTGSTNVSWPPDLHSQLVKRKVPWLWGANFSVGANLQYLLTGLLAKSLPLWEEPQVFLKDRHHKDKKDAPSGTAKKLCALFGQENVRLDVERMDDVAGLHTVGVSTPYESLEVIHEVQDRRVFAHGALWALRELMSGHYEPGFWKMEDIIEQKVKEL